MDKDLVVLEVEPAGDAGRWRIVLGRREGHWIRTLDAVVVEEAVALAFKGLLAQARK